MRGVGPPSRAWEARVIAVIRHPHVFTILSSIDRLSQDVVKVYNINKRKGDGYPLPFSVFAPIIIAMFSCSPKLPQYQLSSPKVQSLISEQLPSVSLLKIVMRIQGGTQIPTGVVSLMR